jgi:hypothetical protein
MLPLHLPAPLPLIPPKPPPLSAKNSNVTKSHTIKSAMPRYPLIRFARGRLHIVERISPFKTSILTNAYAPALPRYCRCRHPPRYEMSSNLHMGVLHDTSSNHANMHSISPLSISLRSLKHPQSTIHTTEEKVRCKFYNFRAVADNGKSMSVKTVRRGGELEHRSGGREVRQTSRFPAPTPAYPLPPPSGLLR